MPLEIFDPRYDAANDQMVFPLSFDGQATTEVRLPRTAMVHGEPWVKARINGLFRYHKQSECGAPIRIEEYEFNANLRQPEG